MRNSNSFIVALLIAAGSLLGTAELAPAAAQTTSENAIQAGISIEGRWTNVSQSVIIVVASCGEHLCGSVEWASEQAREDARKGTDQLVGAQLLTKVRHVRDNRWRGMLYIPDIDRRAHAKIELVDSDRLKVAGCAVGRSLCRSQIWTRVSRPER
jgi:uncharacterized protein (DUF2147 family)